MRKWLRVIKVPNLETAFEAASTDLSCVPCVSVWTETGVCLAVFFNDGKELNK